MKTITKLFADSLVLVFLCANVSEGFRFIQDIDGQTISGRDKDRAKGRPQNLQSRCHTEKQIARGC